MAAIIKKTAQGPGAQIAGQIGVPTTTPVAFYAGDKLYLERMNVLSEDGAGVRCEELPPIGTIMPIVFRLSTARGSIRGRAEILAHLPTTPAGMALKEKLGDKAMPAIVSAGVSDSATAIFRVEDLKRAPAAVEADDEPQKLAPGRLVGFCLHFLGLDPAAQVALAHHLRTSRILAERLAAQGRASMEDDRRTMAQQFHEGDLSERAKDW